MRDGEDMKKIAIAVVVALCLAVAKPAYANIVWATYAPIVCNGGMWALEAHVALNKDEYIVWFAINDYNGWVYIIDNGQTEQAILDAIVAGVDEGGGCY